MFPRIPTPDAWSFRDGVLRLASGPADLYSLDAKNVFLRRQTDTAFTADVLMRVPALAEADVETPPAGYDWAYLGTVAGAAAAVSALENTPLRETDPAKIREKIG